MADNVPLPASSGKAATREVPYSGELAQMQTVGIATFEGTDDNKTATDVTPANPFPVRDPGGPLSLLNRILAVLLSPMGYDRAQGRHRNTAVIESGTVTGLTNIDGRNGSMLINQTNLSAWADCVRARIT